MFTTRCVVTATQIWGLLAERILKRITVNGRTDAADGPIKTFLLRGIKDSPPYLHDYRPLTLHDGVELFSLGSG